jgi:uncharacterized protein with GYD domain
MARYLWKVAYTATGAKGLLDEGGTSRRALIHKLVEAKGGKLETFDYALGEDDAYLIAEVPDVTDVVAISLTVAAAGGARITTIPLITPEDVDAATKKDVQYKAPGA